MKKVRLHPSLLEFRGAMGDMVFKRRNGKMTVSIKPDMSDVEPSQAQAEQRVRFKKAVTYSKAVMADPTLRLIYDTVSEQRGVPAFALGIADFLNLPSIDEVDLSAYSGKIGDKIAIATTDDFGVVNVHLKLTDPNGNTLESGNAIEYPVGSGQWTYTATANVPAGTIVGVTVTATDRPGGVAGSATTKTI